MEPRSDVSMDKGNGQTGSAPLAERARRSLAIGEVYDERGRQVGQVGVCVWRWARLCVLLPEDPLVMVCGLSSQLPTQSLVGGGVCGGPGSSRLGSYSAPWTANRQIAGGPQL